MAFDIYNAADQINHLKTILDDSTLKTSLSISLTEKDDDGDDLGTPNNDGVTTQSPFFLMANYLPQMIINVSNQRAMDQQFKTAEMETDFELYYAFEFDPHSQTHTTMAARLRLICDKLLDYRTAQEPNWYSMSLPTLEIQNEVNRMFEENQIPVAIGRITFTVYNKGVYR